MRFALEQNWGGLSFAVALVAVPVIVLWLYTRVFQSRSDKRLWLLVVLRACALLLVLLLLYRPVVSFERQLRNDRGWAVLIDTSGSMGVRDAPDGRSRLEQVQQALLDQAQQLSALGPVQTWRFDARPASLPRLEAAGALHADGVETDLSGAISAALGSDAARRPQGVLLCSDGIDTGGAHVATVIGATGVPVYAIAAGYDLTTSAGGRDVTVTGVECPLQLTRNTRASITALVDARGLTGRVATVQLLEHDAVVSEEHVTLDDIRGDQAVPLAVTPETTGRHEYTVRIPRLADELAEQNNQHAVSTIVVNARLRVLYLEGGVRAEYGSLVGRYLSRDPAVEFLALVQTRPSVFVQRTNIPDWTTEGIPSDAETLGKFDVFVIGDLDSRFLGEARMNVLKQLVSNGKGLLMVGGQHSFAGGGYGQSPLAEVLPLELGTEPEQVNEEFLLKLTAAGQSHPIFDQIGAALQGQATTGGLQVPPLLGCVRLDRPKPSAEVLAVHPDRGNDQGPLTVLAVQRFGDGRAAAFAADTTYRWFQVLQSLGEESPYIRFWGQMIRWLAAKEETDSMEPGLTVNTDKGFYEPVDAARLEAVLVGQDSRGVDDADLEAVVTSEAAGFEQVNLAFTRQVDRPGGYVLTLPVLTSGVYSVKVTAKSGTDTNETQLSLQVGSPSREFDRLELDQTTLHGIADATGGKYVHVSRMAALLDELQVQQNARRVLSEHRLYHPPLFWLLFVGLVTTEWLLRRKYRLR
jgi:uncharacterized membrane protein